MAPCDEIRCIIRITIGFAYKVIQPIKILFTVSYCRWVSPKFASKAKQQKNSDCIG